MKSSQQRPLGYRDLDSIIILPERKGKKIFLISLMVILSALVSGIAVFVWQMQEIGLISADYSAQLANLTDRQKVLERQIVSMESQLGVTRLVAKSQEQTDIIAKVTALVATPSEVPVVSTITDISKLAGQPIYLNAKNDDKVLFYAKSSSTVIYRPSENRIVGDK